MRSKGTSEQLAEVRARGLTLLKQGKSSKAVAEILGVTRRTVDRWDAEARHPKKKKAKRLPGRPRKLSAKQVKQLEGALDQGAYAIGYLGNYWTLDRIAQLIWQLFEVRYDTSSVWHVLHRMGWSSQRLQRQPLQRNEQAIQQWKEEDLPRIKKVSATGRDPGT